MTSQTAKEAAVGSYNSNTVKPVEGKVIINAGNAGANGAKAGSKTNSGTSVGFNDGKAADDMGVQAGSSEGNPDDMGIKAGGDADPGSTGGAEGAEGAEADNKTGDKTGNKTDNKAGSGKNGGGKNETGDEKPGSNKDGGNDKGKDKESGKGVEEKDPSSKGTTGYSKAGTEAHNIFRKIHKAPALKNNEKMAKEAEAYAKELAASFKFKHSDSKDGENLAMSCNSKKGSELSAADATKMWYVSVARIV